MKSKCVIGLLLLLSLAPLTLAAAACGSGNEANGPMPAPTATPAPTAAPLVDFTTPTPTTEPFDESAPGPVDRIAYVGKDDQVYTINWDGSNRLRITEEGVYSWPTWSPDGRSLVFSGIVKPGEAHQIGLFLGSPSREGTKAIYINDPEVPALIAPSIIHYTLWSPDSQKLAFIAQTAALGLTMYIDNPHDEWNPTLTLGGAPLYSSWSPDSQSLLVHRGQKHFLVDATSYPEPEELPFDSASYRAPAWSPEGENVIVARQDFSGRDVLSLADSHVETSRSIGVITGQTSFLWSPTGDLVAVTQTTDQNQLEYEGIVLVNRDGVPEKTLTTNSLMTFFWSPDGQKIIYATPPDSQDLIKWMLLDVSTGAESELVEFIPSNEFFVMMAFFDQYAYSHSFWSPDGRSFVFAGNLAGSGASALTLQANPKIYVMDVEDGSVEMLAEGPFATWSFN